MSNKIKKWWSEFWPPYQHVRLPPLSRFSASSRSNHLKSKVGQQRAPVNKTIRSTIIIIIIIRRNMLLITRFPSTPQSEKSHLVFRLQLLLPSHNRTTFLAASPPSRGHCCRDNDGREKLKLYSRHNEPYLSVCVEIFLKRSYHRKHSIISGE